MTRAYAPDLFATGTTAPDQLVGRIDQEVGRIPDLRDTFKAIWPTKTAVKLAGAAEVTQRQAERILSGKQGLSLAAYARLVRGEHGYLILAVTMGDARPTWWRELNDGRNIVIAKKEKKLADKRFQEALERGADL